MRYSSKRILVGIEDSESSKPVLEYVADLAGGNSDFVVHVFHAVGPVPLELREFAGAENPNTEEKLDTKLRRKRDEWTRGAKNQAEPLLQNARLQLTGMDIPDHTMTTQVIVLDHQEDFIDAILETAAANRCGTIVVGQRSVPWFKEFFASHTSEELIKRSEGIAICVVQ